MRNFPNLYKISNGVHIEDKTFYGSKFGRVVTGILGLIMIFLFVVQGVMKLGTIKDRVTMHLKIPIPRNITDGLIT